MKEKNIKHTCNKNYVLRMNMLLIIFLSNITQSKKQNEIKGLIVFLKLRSERLKDKIICTENKTNKQKILFGHFTFSLFSLCF